MKLRSLLASVLVISVLMSLTSCHMESNTAKKYRDALNAIGFVEEENVTKWGNYDVDGIYHTFTDKDEIEELVGYTNADKIVSDFEAREYRDGNMLYVSVIDFKDTDSARLDFQSSVILFEQNSPGIATITDNTYVMRSTTEIAYNYLDVIYDVELNGTTVLYIMYVVTDPNSKAASDVVLLYQQLNREIPVCNYSM